MNAQSERGNRPSGVSAAALRDPLVSLDFGGWIWRVYRVFRDNFARLASLALVPIAVVAIYLVAITLAMPDEAEIRQRLAAAATGSPTGTISLLAQFNVLFGRTLPVFGLFLVVFAVVGALYQGCAHYFVLRKANGQPSDLSDALRQAKPRTLPLIGHAVLAALIFIPGVAIPMALGSLLPGSLTRIGPIMSVAVVVGLSSIFWATLNGVVLLERAGIGRCFRLIAKQFWSTLTRILVAWLPYLVYLLSIPLILWLAAPHSGPLTGFSAFLAYTAILALSIPVTVYAVAVSIVTYAGLRFAEDYATTTRSLGAEISRS